jgi:hypothetical protein
MRKTIAAWTIAAAAVLGVTGCSSIPTLNPEATPESSSSATPSTEASTSPEGAGSDQTIADACSIVTSRIEDATSAVSQLDMSQAARDPAGTVATFTETVDSIGAVVESVDNAEVKAAVAAVYEDVVALRDVVSSVLIDQDMTAATGLSGAVSDVQASSQELGTLCSA